MSDTPRTIAEIPRLRPGDVRFALLLLAMTPIAWCLPEPWLDAVARAMMRLRATVKRDTAVNAAHIDRIAGDARLALPSRICAERFKSFEFLERMHMLRWLRPGRWNPDITVIGDDTLTRAAESGTGAFIWTVPFSFSTMVSKRGLAGAGHRISLLSRYHHNLSNTLWGARYINPIRHRSENPYLSDRLWIWPGNESEVLARFKGWLDEGRIVSTNVGSEARRVAVLPFLSGWVRVASGPAAIALRAGAPLIPIFTTREPDGRFTVFVEEPLGPTGPDGLATTVDAMLARYAELLESYVLRYPDQFRWFETLREKPPQ